MHQFWLNRRRKKICLYKSLGKDDKKALECFIEPKLSCYSKIKLEHYQDLYCLTIIIKLFQLTLINATTNMYQNHVIFHYLLVPFY